MKYKKMDGIHCLIIDERTQRLKSDTKDENVWY